MGNLCLLQLIHLNSRRIPRKVLEPIGGRTLLDIGLAKLVELERTTGAKVLIGVSSGDQPLCDLVDRSGLERLDIGERAAGASDASTIVSGWPDEVSKRFDWVCWLNVICRPFLRLQTLQLQVRHAQDAMKTNRPFVTTVKERGLIWDQDGNFVIGAGQLADTKHNPLYHRPAHLGCAHPTDLWDEQPLSAAAEPLAFELLPEERIDIDTPEDLEFARLVYRGMHAQLPVLFDTTTDHSEPATSH